MLSHVVLVLGVSNRLPRNDTKLIGHSVRGLVRVWRRFTHSTDVVAIGLAAGLAARLGWALNCYSVLVVMADEVGDADGCRRVHDFLYVRGNTRRHGVRFVLPVDS